MKRKFAYTGSNVPAKRVRNSKTFYRAKRKAAARAKVTTVIRAPGPIPPRTICKMKYSDVKSSNGTTMDHLFNLNSVFDPDRTGTGHQPYGRDTYATLYNRYRVFAVRYKITYTTTNGSTPGIGMLAWDNDTSLRTNASLWQETPKSRSMIFTQAKPAIMSGKLSLAAVNGVTKEQYKNDDRFQAQAGSDPNENIILHIGCAGLDNSVFGNGGCLFKIDLTYYVEWFDQLTLGQS